MPYGTVDAAGSGASGARRVVVLERDTGDRVATERLLRHQDYWTFATDDPRAVVRVASVDAADLVLVDLALEALEGIPQGRRRRGDTPFPGLSPSFKGGYAVLRPLQADPACARFPLVTLRPGAHREEYVSLCRFAFLDRVPASSMADELLAGLETIWRDVVSAREPAAEAGGVQTARPQPEPASPEPFAGTPLPLRTALVVDPDPSSRARVSESLGRHRFTVHEAASGEEGLRLALARRPVLILTELDLPDESGLDFCDRARTHGLLRRTTLVVLSQWDDCDSRHLALKAGADDFLAKPVSERELLIRLELLLRRLGEGVRGTESAPGLGLRGTLELIGASAILQIGHLSQLTGVLTAHRGSRSVRIGFRQGEIVSALGHDRHGPEVVYDFVGWERGLFEFRAGAPAEGPLFKADFNALLLEGCRRLDERRRATPGWQLDPD